MEKAVLVNLRILQGQTVALLDSINELAWYAEIELGTTTYQQAQALVSRANDALRDTEFTVVISTLVAKKSESGRLYFEAQDVRTMASMLSASLKAILESEALEAEDASSKVAILESKLAEAESRSITLKDDELRDRTLDLLLRPGKADTAVREAAVVLEHRIR